MIGDFTELEASSTKARGARFYHVAAGATAINAGEPVAKVPGAGVVTACATNAGTIGTDYIVGIAATNSTQTATIAGHVYVYPTNSATTWLVRPTVLATWDTQAKYDALVGKRVLIDLTTGSYTLLAADAASHGLNVMSLNVYKHPGRIAVSFSEDTSDEDADVGASGTSGFSGAAGGGSYAEYVQHTQAPNNSVAPGSAIMFTTDSANVFDTIGITTGSGVGGQGTEFHVPAGIYSIDYEMSNDAAWSLAIYKGSVANTLSIDNNTISGSSTATTWIHGKAILDASTNRYFAISPVTGTQAVPTAGTASGQYIARLNITKIG